MSVDHSYEITGQGCSIKINISNIDSQPQDAGNLRGNIYAFDNQNGSALFTSQFSIEELRGLYSFLSQYSVIVDDEACRTGQIIEVSEATNLISNLLQRADHQEIIEILGSVVSSQLTSRDINTLLGRRTVLSRFEEMLSDQASYTEPGWQLFFEENNWIFGYGLDYRYLGILQRESHISRTDLDGSGSVIVDFLMSDSRFTKLVELKKPNTPLFESGRNRSDSWKLSKDLTYAVSQILAQKANWEYESHRDNYDAQGERISEETHDVGSLLIIGCSDQFTGDNREMAIKRRTFELYRRNLRNIEIVLYDELLERAQYLVAHDEE